MSENLLSGRIYSNPDLVRHLQDEAASYCIVNGISLMAPGSTTQAMYVPHSLLPRPIRRSTFEYCTLLAPIMSKLYDRVGRDYDFLRSVLTPISERDDFIKNLLYIMDKALVKGKEMRQSGMPQPLSLTVSRSDYMIDEQEGADGTVVAQAKQVEMNMIASGMGGLSSKITNMHKYLIKQHLPCYAEEDDMVPITRTHHTEAGEVKEEVLAPFGYDYQNVPFNDAHVGIADAFAHAVHEFTTRHAPDSKPVVLMVVQARERNTPDQRTLEYELYNTHDIPLYRVTLDDIRKYSYYDEKHRMYYKKNMVGLVYYRSCYTPTDFPSQEYVDIVADMECSLVVKCPSVSHHLAGTKKIQQILSNEAILRRYLDTEEEVSMIMKVNMKMYALDDDSIINDILIETLHHPQKYVLKPQREGGGNNIWGEDIYKTLQSSENAENRSIYILMERICPRPFYQAMIREGQVTMAPTLTELGVFGALLGDGGEISGTQRGVEEEEKQVCAVEENTSGKANSGGILRNSYVGQLLRTKMEGVDEGGVATGFSVVDSYILID